jgi:Zincin-like metallopeptidase
MAEVFDTLWPSASSVSSLSIFQKTALEPCSPRRIAERERIVAGIPNPPATVQDARAWYRPANDTVGVPSRQALGSAEEYYSTLFHELTHSTGHPSCIGRVGIEVYDVGEIGIGRAIMAMMRTEHSYWEDSDAENDGALIGSGPFRFACGCTD